VNEKEQHKHSQKKKNTPLSREQNHSDIQYKKKRAITSESSSIVTTHTHTQHTFKKIRHKHQPAFFLIRAHSSVFVPFFCFLLAPPQKSLFLFLLASAFLFHSLLCRSKEKKTEKKLGKGKNTLTNARQDKTEKKKNSNKTKRPPMFLS